MTAIENVLQLTTRLKDWRIKEIAKEHFKESGWTKERLQRNKKEI